MAGLIFRALRASIARGLRFSRNQMRRLKRAMLLASVLSALGSTAFATQIAGSPLAATPAADLVALAQRYENGESVPRDYPRALALYCQAAQHGDSRAFFNIGWMFLNGRGVVRDEAAAVSWLRKAAEHGVPQAINLLGLLSRASPSAARGCPAGGAVVVALAQAPPAIRALVDETAQRVGISAQLLLSVMAVESGFNPRAVSPKMAAGLMQLMPATAERFGVRDRFDPRENVRGGATYLRSLLETFSGNLTLALAAYNAGEETVLTRGGVPPYRETIDYVAAVKRLCTCGE
jgi:soluble lytic murein transglycosylase-like protein